jgi:hypothetical protein
MLGGGVAGIALNEAVPLGRVWSFPKVLKFFGIDLGAQDATAVVVGGFSSGNCFLTTEWVSMECLRLLKKNLATHKALWWNRTIYDEFAVGQSIQVKIPQRTIEGFYSGAPPARPPVIQLKSPLLPLVLPALGMPES